MRKFLVFIVMFISLNYAFSSPNETKLSNIIFYNTERNTTKYGLQDEDDEATTQLKKEYKKVVHYIYEDAEWFICDDNKYGNKGWKEEIIYNNFNEKECIIFFADSIQRDLNSAAKKNKRSIVQRNMEYDDAHFKYEKDMEDGTHIIVFNKYDDDSGEEVYVFFW